MSNLAVKQTSSLARRAQSFVYAFRGVRTMLASQQNAQLHAVATVLVVGAGFSFDVTAEAWCALIFAMVAVWTAEALNTALEWVADAFCPSHHPLVGKAKDVAAGAVLIAALGAAVVGALVFCS